MRLTQKNDYFQYVLPEHNVVGDIQAQEILLTESDYIVTKNIIGQAINKIGELEDVLEKWHIEDLDKFIEEQLSKRKELNDMLWKMEGELAKQKAFQPKFEKGQLVYFNDDYGQTLSGSIVVFDSYTLSYIIVDTFGNALWKRKDELFTDKETAKRNKESIDD